MQISDLPYPDPGAPDARSGPRFLLWLGRNQLGGQAKSLVWGLIHFVSVAGLAYGVGYAVQAVVDRSGTGLAKAEGADRAARHRRRGRRHDAAPHVRHELDHRRRPRPAAAGPQDRDARRRPHPAGRRGRGRRGVHRRRGEDRLVRRGALPLHRRRAHHRHRRRGSPDLPARARRRRRARHAGPGARRAAPAPPRHPAGGPSAGEGGPCHRTRLGHRRGPARAARHRR